ncbi:hypothetical protein [Ethanoligenens harbinense]|uniref:Uncharacterized protein n=1 Tax=Ethanoligenens harbinense (strain DSM 18485 / JCM 12961 / CGMCC 1.5033 / YUAN-3) TaxID=663278 RepID=E6U5W8_ETHHY|nr:hypothetical protein [Ethanoligenens harbinense]ADU27985.1 hypothetical protein Ethha_2492 [Ethanoligenens harbinense YUAN-3]
MNTIQSIAKLEALIASLAGYSAEDYQEIEDAAARGLERARVELILKDAV